jgi:hypothetical protein
MFGWLWERVKKSCPGRKSVALGLYSGPEPADDTTPSLQSARPVGEALPVLSSATQSLAGQVEPAGAPSVEEREILDSDSDGPPPSELFDDSGDGALAKVGGSDLDLLD